MESSTLVDLKFIEATDDVVALVAHGPMDHGRTEVEENGVKVTRCDLYPNLECAEHERNSEVLLKYFNGRFRLPHMIFCDGDGKELFRRGGYRRPDELRKDLRDAIAKMPGKKLTRDEYKPLASAFDAGLAAANAMKWVEAAEKLRPLATNGPAGMKEKAAEVLGQMKELADAQFAAGRDLVAAKRLDDARRQLKEVADNYPSFESGAEAAALLKKMDEKK